MGGGGGATWIGLHPGVRPGAPTYEIEAFWKHLASYKKNELATKQESTMLVKCVLNVFYVQVYSKCLYNVFKMYLLYSAYTHGVVPVKTKKRFENALQMVSQAFVNAFKML